MELFNQARVERQLSAYTRSMRRRYRWEAIYQPTLVYLGILAAGLLLYAAGWAIMTDQFSLAALLTLGVTFLSAYRPLTRWWQQWPIWRQAGQSAQGVFTLLDRRAEVGQAVGAEFLPTLSKLVEFDHVSLKEPGSNRLLLHNVSLQIRTGQRVALVGPDDLEKYALVYLIPRFLDPKEGEIRIDDHDIRWVTLESLRIQVALVMQRELVFNDTVAHNIGGGDPDIALPQIIEAAKIAHAHNFIQRMPNGYETRIGELGKSLTLGEQYRIALARAILRDPALMIIEEPTTALDADTRTMLEDTFARFLPGRTCIFLPHQVSTLQSCDQVFLLHKGRIVADGTHRELLAHNELYRHLHYYEFNLLVEPG
jgi:ATP-binding cassette subfamily B protein